MSWSVSHWSWIHRLVPESPNLERASRKRVEKLVRNHAAGLLRQVLQTPFEEEIFLAGGAFKPLVNPEREVRDLDLWVRNRKVRERLVTHLTEKCGAELVEDFHPYCIKFAHPAAELEITYQNLNDRDIDFVLDGFDIAGCAIAAHYENGKVIDCRVSESALQSIRERKAMLNAEFVNRRKKEHAPDLLRSIDRLEGFSREMGFEVEDVEKEQLWTLFERVYSEEEREACVETYLTTTVDYKGHGDPELLKRAGVATEDVVLAS